MREPNLNDLSTFIEDEVTLASDPLFSKEALNERLSLAEKPGSSSFSNSNQSRNRSIKTLLTNINCQLCLKDHDIEMCPLFKGKDIKETIMKFRLCFGCYGKDHQKSNCKSKRVCTTCKKDHPTGLHDYVGHSEKSVNSLKDTPVNVPKPKPDVKTFNVEFNESFKSMCVVPVILRHPCSKSDIMTFALLDTCSQGSFISQDLVDSLSVDNIIRTEITIKTLFEWF